MTHAHPTGRAMMGDMDNADPDRAEVELTSLLRKSGAFVGGNTLSPSRQALMLSRAAVVRTPLALVAESRSDRAT